MGWPFVDGKELGLAGQVDYPRRFLVFPIFCMQDILKVSFAAL
jgi:hypothetical protein